MRELIENIRAVGFDIDGTLYFQNKEDSFLPNLYGALATTLSISSDEVLTFFETKRAQYGNSLQTARALCAGHVAQDLLDELFWDILEKHEEIDTSQYDSRLSEYMKELSTQYRLFVVTGNRERHAARKFSALGIDSSLFHATCYGTENKYEGMKGISESLGVSPSQMIYFGDQEKTDIRCAADLGMVTVKIGASFDTYSSATFQARQVFELKELLLGK